MTTLIDTEIVYDRVTKDYAIKVNGTIVAYAPTYSAAELERTQRISQKRSDYARADEAAKWDAEVG